MLKTGRLVAHYQTGLEGVMLTFQDDDDPSYGGMHQLRPGQLVVVKSATKIAFRGGFPNVKKWVDLDANWKSYFSGDYLAEYDDEVILDQSPLDTDAGVNRFLLDLKVGEYELRITKEGISLFTNDVIMPKQLTSMSWAKLVTILLKESK